MMQTEESGSARWGHGVAFGAAYWLRDDKAFANTLVQACSSRKHEARWLVDEISRGFSPAFGTPVADQGPARKRGAGR